MTLTLELPPDVESHLHELSARSGQRPEEYVLGLLREKSLTDKTEDESEAAWEDYQARFGHEPGPTPEEVVAGLRQSAQEIAAGHWLSLEELAAAMRARRPSGTVGS